MFLFSRERFWKSAPAYLVPGWTLRLSQFPVAAIASNYVTQKGNIPSAKVVPCFLDPVSNMKERTSANVGRSGRTGMEKRFEGLVCSTKSSVLRGLLGGDMMLVSTGEGETWEKVANRRPKQGSWLGQSGRRSIRTCSSHARLSALAPASRKASHALPHIGSQYFTLALLSK